MRDLHAEIERMKKELRGKDLTIQGKDDEIGQRQIKIQDLMAELERMRQAAANGDMNSAELSRQLQET